MELNTSRDINNLDINNVVEHLSRKGFGGYNLFILPTLSREGEIGKSAEGVMTALYKDVSTSKIYGMSIEYDTVGDLVNAVAKLYNTGEIRENQSFTHLIEIELRSELSLVKTKPLIVLDLRGIDVLICDKLIVEHNIVPFGYDSHKELFTFSDSFKSLLNTNKIEGIIDVKLGTRDMVLDEVIK